MATKAKSKTVQKNRKVKRVNRSVVIGTVTCHSHDGRFSAQCNLGDKDKCILEIERATPF